MNTGFYKDLDTNFEQAYKLCSENLSHYILMEMLQNGNIPQKQIAALKLDKLESIDEAFILISNLTGCDGKIREAVALKIYTLISENCFYGEYFSKVDPQIFADATIDINSNICRLVVDSVALLRKYDNFSKKYTECILNYTNKALDELDRFIFRDKKYVINKQLFKLYWCLDSLKSFYNLLDESTLYNILKRSAAQKEYTIREKVAQIIVLSGKFNDLETILKNDENYYVRTVFLNHESLL